MDFVEVLKACPNVLAPMVEQSELPFRMLVRKHACRLCYTPMITADRYLAAGEEERLAMFSSAEGDRPLIAQFCATNREDFVAACKLVESQVDGVDLNLGCPQRRAEIDGFGAFLMDSPEVVRGMVEAASAALSVPVCCKIRILPTVEATVKFALMLEQSGCKLLVVHGRPRTQQAHRGPADWEAIAAVKRAVRIPIIANGNVHTREDARACLRCSGADGVMSATGLLANPAMFAEEEQPPAVEDSSAVPPAAPEAAQPGYNGDNAGDGDGDGGGGGGGGGGDSHGEGQGVVARPASELDPALARALLCAVEYLQLCQQYPPITEGCAPEAVMAAHLNEMLLRPHLHPSRKVDRARVFVGACV
jgi:tRNA-dihydrouridine synthase